MLELWDYQAEAVAALRGLLAGLSGVPGRERRVVLQAATGAGKTVVAVELMRLAWRRGRRCLFLAHRRELVDQCGRRLAEHGVPHGLLMRGRPLAAAPVQVASKDTLLERAVRSGRWELPPADLVVVDECHLSLAAQYQALLAAYGHACQVGLTATPVQGNGHGLGWYWRALHCCPPDSELIRRGRIVPCRVFAPSRPDLSGLPCGRNGDYQRGPLEGRMNRPKLVGDVVTQWLRLADGKRTILFASGINHSLECTQRFLAAGVRAAHIDGGSDPDVRQRVLDDLRAGNLQVVCNVGILPEGVDIPPVEVVQLVRPTKSFVLYKQMVGRIKRPWTYEDGRVKTHALVLDHAGAVFRHGLPDADVPWELGTGRKIQDVLRERLPPGEPEPLCCPKCYAVFTGTKTCPNCGHELKRRARGLRHDHRLLTEVDRVNLDHLHDPEVRRRYWHRCVSMSVHGGRKLKAAGCMYKSHFGNWPEGWLPNRPADGAAEWDQNAALVFPAYANRKRR